MKIEKNEKLEIPVIKVSQRIGDYYIGSVKAKDLLNITYVDRMRLKLGEDELVSYLGIQRSLKTERLKSIARYIKNIDSTFPTSILLSITEDCAELQTDGNLILKLSPLSETEITNRINLGILEPKNIFGKESIEIQSLRYSGIAKVIDGQHRLAGIAYAIDEIKNKSQLTLFDDESSVELLNALENFEFNVSFFIGYDIHTQAKMFGVVNLQQTKVNKSIVYNLEEYAETRSPQSVCHNIAKILDTESNSPFYKKIKMLGCKTIGRINDEPLTQATFVESLLQLISKDPESERDMLKRKNIYGKTRYLEHSETEKQKYVFRDFFENKLDGELLDVIWNYFTAIKNRWPEAWEDTQSSLLPKNNCFRALIRFLRDKYPDIATKANKKIPFVEEFENLFQNFEISDVDFDSSKGIFPRGDGGMSKFYKYLSGKITYAELKQEN